jgi:hypothetical protein
VVYGEGDEFAAVPVGVGVSGVELGGLVWPGLGR